MDWFILSLFSAVLVAIISTIDKIVIDRYFYNSYSYPFFTAFFLGFYSLVVLFYRISAGVFTVPSIGLLLLAMSSALTHIIGAVFLTKALMVEDAATVFSLTQLNPIFALLWGMIFFGDFFQPINYLGVVLLVACAFLISSRRSEGGKTHYRWNKAIGLVLLAAITKSLGDLFLKIALNQMDTADVFALNRAALIIAALALLIQPDIRRQISQPVRRFGLKIIFLAGIIELFAMANMFLYVQAFAGGPLALVSAVQATMPMFILALTALANHLSPGFVPVRSSDWTGVQKAMLSGGIVAGAYLLYAGRS